MSERLPIADDQCAEQVPYRPVAGEPLPPAQDPFCDPPGGFALLSPGTVLRAREVDVAFLGRIRQKVTAYQLLYRTADMRGTPQATLTTVLVPRTSAAAPRPILSYQCAIDAMTSQAFPSYALRAGATILGGAVPFEYLLVAACLERGWAVLVPDHEGQRGIWGAPREPGYCVLDSIRAALNFAPAGLSRAAPVGLWGYSGGGLATGWAAQLWSSYASELNIVGVAMGSPVGDLGAIFRHLNGSVFAGLGALVIGALRHAYPEFAEIVREHTDADGMALLDELGQMSTARALLRFPLRKVDRYLDEPLEQMLRRPVVERMLDDIRLGHDTPAMPMLMVQAVNDPIITVGAIDALAGDYRAGGAALTYLRDVFSEHVLLHTLAAPATLNWLAGRFDGRRLPPPRTRRTALAVCPRTWLGLLRLGYVVLKVLSGRRF